MKLSELAVLLPCHSLEDFPVYYEGREADELLAAWGALWHPALVAAAGALPTFHRVDVPPETLAGRLMTVPPFCVERLPAGFVARAEAESAGLVRESRRDAAVQAALAGLDDAGRSVDDELAADFLALGTCRLYVELLTRQMRYSVNIDETHFQNEVVAGARAAVAGDVAKAREHLDQCFATLHEARNRFYPVDVYLLDLTLLAPTTPATALARELGGHAPINLMATTELLGALAAEQPENWSALLAAIDRAAVCVLGGEDRERALPLLPLESVGATLTRGARRYEALFGRLPHVYARRRAGLCATLPQLLVKLGYQGALHFTLDDGRFPLGQQSKMRWEGLDASTLDAYCRVPYDAARSETFVGLPRMMSDTMDNDHVATVAFAHWPGEVSPWYDDLKRIAGLSPVLGKFMLLDDYFAHTDMPGRLTKFEPDQYRTPYLKQAIERGHRDAISAFVREHVTQARRATAQSVSALAALARGTNVARGVAAAGSVRDTLTADATEADELVVAVEELAAALPAGTGPSAERRLVVNPLSFARRIGVELSGWDRLPEVAGSVIAAGAAKGRSFAVVDVPAMGFAWIAPGAAAPSTARGTPIARDNVLVNEFFELTVGSKTGGIQSLYDYAHRGNQFSQQLAFRMPGAAPEPGSAWRDPDEDAQYSTMCAEQVEITVSCPAFGEIVSRGTLVGGDEQPLARFRQSVQVWAGSRVIRLEIELDALQEPPADPWNSYFAARFAWPDETAQLWRGVGLARQRTDAARLEAPEYIDVESPGGHVTVLAGGLPYHRRAGARMLDSLLVVRGETTRKFSLGIGVSLPQPAPAATEFLTPPVDCATSGPVSSTTSGWFFHVDARNVVATHWEPLIGDAAVQSSSAAGELPVTGFRARLLETAGRSGRVTLRALRHVAHARQVDLLGQTLLEAPVDGDKITLDFAAHEWIEVEAVWSN